MLSLSVSLTLIYSAVFLSGWNYSFLTATKQNLWCTVSLTITASVISYWALTEYIFILHLILHWHLTAAGWHKALNTERKDTFLSTTWWWLSYKHFKRQVAVIHNNFVSHDSALTVLLKVIIFLYIVDFFYCHTCTYIFITDIIKLCSLSSRAYETVNWSNFIPHFWRSFTSERSYVNFILNLLCALLLLLNLIFMSCLCLQYLLYSIVWAHLTLQCEQGSIVKGKYKYRPLSDHKCHFLLWAEIFSESSEFLF